MSGAVLTAIGGALFLGAVMTIGDFVWAHFDVRHTTMSGVLHGVVMCLCLGAVVGARTGRFTAGLLIGPWIGVVAAGAFYALAPILRWGAMLPAWMLFWICFGLLQHALLRETLPKALGRGLVAAVVSGLAFYAISGIWTNPPRGGPNYGVFLAYWSFAFLPGFLALFVGAPLPGRTRTL